MLSANHLVAVNQEKSPLGYLGLVRTSSRLPFLQQEASEYSNDIISSLRASKIPPLEDAESLSKNFDLF